MKSETKILNEKLEICLKALEDISKSKEWVEGDYSYNQKYESPTRDSYTAKNALKAIEKIK